MIPHRPPPDVPVHLLDPAERQALADFGGTDWGQAARDAARRAIEDPDATLLRTVGLTSSALRPGQRLGERSLGDDRLGREVLTELARKQRGER